MSTLNQETRVENITLSGVIDKVSVRLSFSRENENVRQITVNANSENGMPVAYLDWQPANQNLTMAAYNCGLNDVPMDLIEQLLAEMKAVK